MLSREILEWAEAFHAGELTLDDVHERFAAVDVGASDLSGDARKAVLQAQRTLDAIRYGMCEAGQRDEITNIFNEFALLFRAEQQRLPRS